VVFFAADVDSGLGQSTTQGSRMMASRQRVKTDKEGTMKYILLMYAEEGAWPPDEHR